MKGLTMPKDVEELSAASAGSTAGALRPYYQKDGITIYHGDCLEVLHGLEGIGAVVTDPPYSSGGAFRGDRAQSTVSKYVNSDTAAYRPEFAGDNRDQRSFLVWCSMWMNAARLASVPGSPIAVFTDWRQLPTTTDAIQAAGWTWRNVGTWWKPGCRMQKGRFSSSAEYVVYGSNGPAAEGMASPQNVISVPPAKDKIHIAEKPLAVMAWVFGLVPPSATVLDPFMGSGATLEAAKHAGCSAIGVEVDERYCEMAANRLSQEVLF
jgi:site-specific DNA-methyltransferase (adenine-specific)